MKIKHSSVKISELRKNGYTDIEDWINTKGNIYVGRRGRVNITSYDKTVRTFHYSDSKFGNPFKDYDLKTSLKMYKEHIYNSGLINELGDLTSQAYKGSLNLGCFCLESNPCHAKVLAKIISKQISVYIVEKDILDLDDENDSISQDSIKIIAHQTNCTSKRSKGLSKYIFDRYPESNTYISDFERIPGTISVHSVEDRRSEFHEDRRSEFHEDRRSEFHEESSALRDVTIINMYAQRYPGKPRDNDTSKHRIKWFKSCLDEISKLGFKSIRFPYKIGCGLAKGDWRIYKRAILEFASINPN